MDVKAGGGQVMTIGDMLRAFLTKLEWFSTLFPRIPVPIQVRTKFIITLKPDTNSDHIKRCCDLFPPNSTQTTPKNQITL